MKALLAAFLKAQSEFTPLTKDASNPAFRSSYATLEAVQAAAFSALRENGLVVIQEAASELTDKGLIVRVAATLYHVESGESIAQELGLIPVKADPQGVGSAITYARRYSLMTLLGLAPEDDDGNAASGAPKPAAPVKASALTPLPKPAPAPAQPPQRPDWKTPGEAIDYGEAIGLFKAHQHARNAFAEIVKSICGREGVSPAELPHVFDTWFADLQRRQATANTRHS